MRECVCPEAINLLQEHQFAPDVTRVLRDMNAIRQVQTVDQIISSNTVTAVHAGLFLKADPPEQRTDVKLPTKENKTACYRTDHQTRKELSQVQ
jgi:hypothetical protein